MGGDEFVIILSSVRTKADLLKTADEILLTFVKPINLNGLSFNVSLSIGFSMYPEDGNIPDQLLEKADKAMYRSKGIKFR